jgi:chromosome segregation protein
LATLDERLKGATASSARARQRVEEQDERVQSISSQMRGSEAERVRLLEDNVELESQIEQQCARRAEAEREASDISQTLTELRGRVEASEEQIGVERSSLDQIRDHRSTIEVRLAEIRSEVKHLEEECKREIGKPIQQVSDGESKELTDEELATAEAQCQETRAKLDNLGPVNVLALEEFQEAKDRLDFLEAQKKDLLDSIADTQTAIAEIDAVSRHKFQEAFEAINKNFHEVFRTLFGGGQAEMRLTDESNLVDSGIDIIASPPGKRLQNVALLSGGEKSLTAVALLMATFQYKPSPFCVLDEVDAALDEPNLARFSRLVSEMSDRTQFILITHSKTTMETAQTLYGVTMQQPGVSQLVSVRMADHQNGRVVSSQQVAG